MLHVEKLLSPLNVTAEIDLVRQFSNINLESVLHLVEDLCVALVGHEGDREPLGAKSSRPGHPVEIGVGVFWHVVIEDDVHSFNVHSSPKKVGGHQDSFLEILELLIPEVKSDDDRPTRAGHVLPAESFLLSHPSMNGNSRKVLLYQELRKSHTSLHGLDKDDDLVEEGFIIVNQYFVKSLIQSVINRQCVFIII